MTRVGKDWEDAMRMLERELQKRDENLEDKTRKLSVALKEIQEFRAKYNDRVDFTNEMSLKTKEQDKQTKSLIEIVQYLQN